MKKIAILATDDFEDLELQVPLERLKEAGYKVLVVGPVGGKIIVGKKGRYRVKTDLGVDSVKPGDFDALIVPGGYSPDRLRLNMAAVELVRAFGLDRRPIAAICHGPQLLISAGLVNGRTLTSWPSVAIDVKNAGGHYVDEPVVIDGNLVTSRKPADLPQFIDAIISVLQEHEKQLTA